MISYRPISNRFQDFSSNEAALIKSLNTDSGKLKPDSAFICSKIEYCSAVFVFFFYEPSLLLFFPRVKTKHGEAAFSFYGVSAGGRSTGTEDPSADKQQAGAVMLL